MKRVYILAEGETEEAFINGVLAQHLWNYKVYLRPILTGGIKSYARHKRDIRRLLHDRNAVVTTMFDLYGLPDSFPEYATRPLRDPYAKVTHLEHAMEQDINNRRFKAYLQLHEYEALLFTQPEKFGEWTPGTAVVEQIIGIKNAFNSPEEIDDGAETAPSKQIKAVFPGYQKVLHGPMIVAETGLDAIRAECLHFNDWLTWLETLG